MKRIIVSLLFSTLLIASIVAQGWEGTYIWNNPTKKTNGGKMSSLMLKVVEVEEEWLREIWLLEESGEYRIFPVVPPTSEGYSEWHKYGEKTSEGESFRHNNKKINLTPVNPGKWMVSFIESTSEESFSSITVSAFNMKIKVSSLFSFSLDENGKEQLTFALDTDKDFAKGLFFTNPDQNGDGSFVLTKIDE